MNRKRTAIAALVVAALLLVAVPALAGAWAEIELEPLPDRIVAGEPLEIGFTILQHGNKPVHELPWGDKGESIMLEPLVSAQNPATGESVSALAQPGKEQGYWIVQLTLPSDGLWDWSIAPQPLAGVTELEPLSVSSPPAAVPIQASAPVPGLLRALLMAVALIAAAGVAWYFVSRRRGEAGSVIAAYDRPTPGSGS